MFKRKISWVASLIVLIVISCGDDVSGGNEDDVEKEIISSSLVISSSQEFLQSSETINSSIAGSSLITQSSSSLEQIINISSSISGVSSSVKIQSSSSVATLCVDKGRKGYLRADFENICLNTDSILPHEWGGGIVFHDTALNIDYIITRDGDGSDGTLSIPGNYDASIYPYNLLFYEHRLNDLSSCEHGTSCTDFYGVSGSWDIDSYGTSYKGTGVFAKIVDGHQENCWDDGNCIFIENASLEARWEF